MMVQIQMMMPAYQLVHPSTRRIMAKCCYSQIQPQLQMQMTPGYQSHRRADLIDLDD
jgi:hypothetical protein